MARKPSEVIATSRGDGAITTPWAAAGVAKAAMRAAKATYLFMRSSSYFRDSTRSPPTGKTAFGNAALRNRRAADKDLRVPKGSVVRPTRKPLLAREEWFAVWWVGAGAVRRPAQAAVR